ncbi:MAG: hypothetical protein IKG65_06115, partial [Exiguobacterium sp.]|nr:hypothetical protein [Exiguobacterium sp.]
MGGIVYRKVEGDTVHLIIVSKDITRHRVEGGVLVHVENWLCPIETAELLYREQDEWSLGGEPYRSVVT